MENSIDNKPLLINNDNIHEIISYAKAMYPKATFPMRISKRELTHQESVNVLIMESLIVFLNKNGILNKLVNLDYTKD